VRTRRLAFRWSDDDELILPSKKRSRLHDSEGVDVQIDY